MLPFLQHHLTKTSSERDEVESLLRSLSGPRNLPGGVRATSLIPQFSSGQEAGPACLCVLWRQILEVPFIESWVTLKVSPLLWTHTSLGTAEEKSPAQ